MTTAAADREFPLLDRLGGGDVGALDTVVERHAARLYRLAHGITRSAAAAEAVVQDVFAALLDPRGHDPAVPLHAWLDRTATRAALARRDDGPAADPPLDHWLPVYRPDGHRDGDRTFVTADWSGVADAQLVDRGVPAIVSDTLDALPARDRAILLLADLEGLSPEAVAEVVGVDPALVRGRLHHLRMALRERITRALAPPAALP